MSKSYIVTLNKSPLWLVINIFPLLKAASSLGVIKFKFHTRRILVLEGKSNRLQKTVQNCRRHFLDRDSCNLKEVEEIFDI